MTTDSTLHEWITWFISPENNKSLYPHERTIMHHYLENYIEPIVGRFRLSEYARSHARKLYNDMTHLVPDRRIRYEVLTLFRLAMEEAAREHLIADPCSEELRILNPVRLYSDKEIHQILQAIEDDPYRNIYHMIYYSHLQVAEICGLEIEDINFDHHTIHIHNKVGEDPETGLRALLPAPESICRTIPIHEEVEASLRSEINMRTRNRQLWCWEDDPPHTLFVYKTTGHFLGSINTSCSKKKITSKTGIRDFTMKSLWYTGINKAMQNGVTPTEIQQIAGYASPITIYHAKDPFAGFRQHNNNSIDLAGISLPGHCSE